LVRGLPAYIRSDNGPEFIAKAVQQWLEENHCRTIYIEPGSPWEIPYIESFNGKLREECLNQYVFTNTREAQEIVSSWREEYNQYRPHSSLVQTHK
jgi:putative transposase